MTSTKEKTRRMIKMEAGKLILTAEIAIGLDKVENWHEHVEARRSTGRSVRVPLLFRDTSAQWWWMGLRSACFVKSGERVAIWGRQRRAESKTVDFTQRGRTLVWVVDDSPALTPGSYSAPWPLATSEDGRRYVEAGVEMQTPLPRIAKILGWSGPDAIQTADKFRNLVLATWMKRDTAAQIERLSNVSFPGRKEHLEKRMEWGEFADIVSRQVGESAAVADKVSDSAKRIDRLVSRLDSLERYIAEIKKRHVEDTVELRAEVARLRDLVI